MTNAATTGTTWRSACTLILVLALAGATYAQGFGDVTFTSDPTGAELIVDGVRRGPTPITLRLPVGAEITYEIEGRPPTHKGFTGRFTVPGDAIHPTWLDRYTAEERRQLQGPPPTARSATPVPPPPSATAPRTFSSSSGRPAPNPGERITATPRFVVAFLANELELRSFSCPQAPVPIIECGISFDGEVMIAALVDALFDIYLQPSSREVRWYRDRASGAYVGAFRRPEGVYAISLAGTGVTIGYVGP